MRRSTDINLFDFPEDIDRFIAGDRRYRVDRLAGNIVNPFGRFAALLGIKAVDLVTVWYGVPFAFFAWSIMSLTGMFNRMGEQQSESDGSSLTDTLVFALVYTNEFLAGMVIASIFLSMGWNKLKGTKAPDYTHYSDYYELLGEMPALSGPTNAWKKRVVTDPHTEEEVSLFIQLHQKHIAWLGACGNWDAIMRILEATRRRFSPGSGQAENNYPLMRSPGGYVASTSDQRTQARADGIVAALPEDYLEPPESSTLSQHLTNFVARRWYESAGLSADKNRVTILRNLLSYWLKTGSDDEPADSSLFLTELFKPAWRRQERRSWEYFLKCDAIKTQAFKQFPVAEQVQIIHALMSGNDAGKITALSLIHDTANFSKEDRQRLISAYAETYQEKPDVRENLWLLLNHADDALCLEGLVPLINESNTNKDHALVTLFRMTLSDAWPDAFLDSFMCLYKTLSSEQQADMNQYFSMFRQDGFRERLIASGIRQTQVDRALHRMGAALLIATHRHTKPKTETERETDIMLNYLMPGSWNRENVFLWSDAWQGYRREFLQIDKKDLFLTITRRYFLRRFIEAKSNAEPEAAAMILLGAYQAGEKVFFESMIKDIVDHGKMADVLKALMQVLPYKHKVSGFGDDPSGDREDLKTIAVAFIKELLDSEAVNLSPEEAAWICHLYGKGANIMHSVKDLHQTFNEVSDAKLDRFQTELLLNALQHILALEDPRSVADVSPDEVVALSFYSPVRRRRYEGLSEAQKKASRIVGDTDDFITELYRLDYGSNEEAYVLKSSYRRFFDLLVEVTQNRWGALDEAPEGDSIRGLIFQHIFVTIEKLSDEHKGAARNKPIIDRIVYFMLRALLESPEMESRYRCPYLIHTIERYRALFQTNSIPDTFYQLHSTTYAYSDRDGVLGSALELAQAFLERARELRKRKTDQQKYDLIVSDKQADEVGINIIHDLCCQDRWAQFFRRAEEGRTLLTSAKEALFELIARFDKTQVNFFLESKPLGMLSLKHFLQAQACGENKNPARMLLALQYFWRQSDQVNSTLYNGRRVSCQNNINLTFSQLGLVQANRSPSLPSHFDMTNLLLEHLINLPAAGRGDLHAKLLINFIDTMRAEDARHHQRPFATLVLPKITTARLVTFKNLIAGGTKQALRGRIRTRLTALLIYSLYPPNQALALFNAPRYSYAVEAQKILEIFDYPTALGETEAVCRELRAFGMDEVRLQRIIRETTEQGRAVPAREATISF